MALWNVKVNGIGCGQCFCFSVCTTAHALRHDLCVTTVLFYFFKHILMVGGAIGREGRSGEGRSGEGRREEGKQTNMILNHIQWNLFGHFCCYIEVFLFQR